VRSVFIGSVVGLLAVVVLAGTAHASAVPEMDPGGAVSAVALLAGVGALAMERLRRK